MTQPLPLNPAEDPDVDESGRVKPHWRGRLHQGAFFASFPAGALLIVLSRHPAAYVGASIYAVSLLALFGTSATYHRGRWTTLVRQRMQRLDHGMIFVLIAGTFTPLTLLAVRGVPSIVFLVLAWVCAAVGIVLALVRFELLDRYDIAFYLGFAGLLLVALPALVRTLTTAEIVLLVGGGALYVVGSIGFRLERPNPRPLVFGYHEVWHSMTIAAAICHYTLVMQLVRT